MLVINVGLAECYTTPGLKLGFKQGRPSSSQVMWPGVEPALKETNKTYLENLVELTARLGERGLFVLADLHQDRGV